MTLHAIVAAGAATSMPGLTRKHPRAPPQHRRPIGLSLADGGPRRDPWVRRRRLAHRPRRSAGPGHHRRRRATGRRRLRPAVFTPTRSACPDRNGVSALIRSRRADTRRCSGPPPSAARDSIGKRGVQSRPSFQCAGLGLSRGRPDAPRTDRPDQRRRRPPDRSGARLS